MNNFSFLNQPEHPLPPKVMDKLAPFMIEVNFPKGHILFNSDKPERNVYIIKRGIARAYIEVDGKDISIWFGQENDIIISAQGYVYGKKGYETMELLENSTLYKISLHELMTLYQHDLETCNWGRQLIEREFVKTEQRLIYNLSVTATERYLHLLQEMPGILQRVQLQHIASYLGISSEHLSRIRSNTKKIVP